MNRKSILRILDANLNRSREGLRVCEEIARFVMSDAVLTRRLKKARHEISRSLQKLPASLTELLLSRDVRGDVGKKPSRLERSREGPSGLFLANCERAKESLRVLEETSKLIDPEIAVRFKKARFDVYAIEKKALPKLESLRHH